MRFRAKILNVVKQGTITTINSYNPKTEFSKSQIFVDPLPTYQSRITVGGETINAGTHYTLDKVYNDNGKKLWQITINRKPNCTTFIELNWMNKVKCNLLHRRYLFQRETDWFWKAIITAAIGFAFSLIALYVGYRQGYQTGLKECKEMTQK